MFPNARIPYGAWASTWVPAWNTSALAQVDMGHVAGAFAAYGLSKRGIRLDQLKGLVTGSTIPVTDWFWEPTLVSTHMGSRLSGMHVEQACATGLVAPMMAASEVQLGDRDVMLALTFDRTSRSPVMVTMEDRVPASAHALVWVWGNFKEDPSAGNSMVEAAGNAARSCDINRGDVDRLTLHRYEQYQTAINGGLLDGIMIPITVLGNQGQPLGRVDADYGIRDVTADGLRGMPELASCVTPGTQTHPSDGAAFIVVCTKDKVPELTLDPGIDIRFIAKAEVRAKPALMPLAPGKAVNRVLEIAGIVADDLKVVHTHNPFAVNDLVISSMTGIPAEMMNSTGCPLVWGHPQGPTLTRVLIEALEVSVNAGGGYVLVTGCAAGDVGIAGLFKVDDTKRAAA